jgi:hypothetical protein
MEAIAALVIATATLVASITSLVMAFKNSVKINEVHLSINSRMDQLLAAHGAEMKAEGAAEERSRPQAIGNSDEH